MLKPGQLRYKITIQQKTVTQDAEGFSSDTWTDFDSIWAAQKDLGGRNSNEVLAAQAITAEVRSIFTIRYHNGIVPGMQPATPAMRILWLGRTFDILSVIDPEGLRREQQLLCKEVLSGGGQW